MAAVPSVSIRDLRSCVGRNQTFLDFWVETVLRPDRPSTTADYDPLPIWALWPNLVVHDLSTPGKSILRQVGTGIVKRLGQDPTGKCYSTLISPERKETALSYLHAAAWQPCGMSVILEWAYADEPLVRKESIGLPLTKKSDADGRLLVFCHHDLPVDEDDVLYRRYHLTDVVVVERTFIDVGYGTPDMPLDERTQAA